ncbi:MAG: menaquinone-dependent protoporphyrinogen IX dehydrogenase [Sideroxydans sp.]|nr:menaquinone-dependent protoporphyrinogen IX dehydrogenase [Sideroxydans sp.]
MANILILYSTTDGHTRTICLRIREVAERDGHAVTLLPIREGGSVDLSSFDKIVIGASIRYGKHSPLVIDFIDQHRHLLDERPNAFFSVNVVARKPEKNRPDTNPYLQKFLRQSAWRPRQLEVFAGKINYALYNPVDRFMIRLIMLITKGPTALDTHVEYTDWQRVEDFGRLIGRM